jgi:F-type H+-transporting ATPase subunit epsilon
MQLDIVTPTRRLRSIESEHVRLPCETTSVRVPGADGEFEVLPGHAPFLAVLGTGILTFEVDGKEVHLMVSGGFCDVDRDRVSVMCEEASLLEEVDVSHAEKTLKDAEKQLQELGAVAFDDSGYRTLRTEAERATSKLRLVK